MNTLDKILEEERKKEQKEEEQKKKSKCYRCEWGHWDGYKHFCIFPKCTKG